LERIEPTEDGGCLWSAEVAEWREMLPWVRGWGADCEVLEPEKLRAEIIQHVRDLANQYKVMTTKMNAYSFLWAKADKKDSSKVHRLVYHLIDVGQVALVMWNKALDKETKRKFCEWLKCDEETAGRTLAFLISLHDLGKASPTFQLKIKYQQIIDEIRKAGFWLPKNHPPESSPHGVVSTWILGSLLPKMLNISDSNATMIAIALGGHHGTWPTPPQRFGVNSNDKGNADSSWDTARQELVQAMIEVFNPALEFSLPEEQEELNIMLTLFSGFTSVADWVGSMTEHFPYEKSVNLPIDGLDGYVVRSAKSAEKALDQLGWFGWQADGKTLTFNEMFPFEMNSVQAKVVQEAGKISQPALLILESPTGSGKTEAALYTADIWLQFQSGHGIYIAMPTQATSNQMHKRTKDFLLKRYPDEKNLNFHLVHGGALLDDKKPVEAQGVSDEDNQDKTEGGVRAETWFLPRKRTLLAPFGVGTVDQALMSVLQTRHFFVRMFGLQNKVVVFDEVHAYDTYMSELFKRLLTWLRQIGVSVILLSATLPEKTRRELTAAYLGEKDVNLPPAKYPRLTIASKEGVQSIPLESPSSRKVQLEWSDVAPVLIVEKLKDALRNGGCAAVICNRVQRAQDVYNEIKQAGLVSEEDLILFHARFPFQWRNDIEKLVLGKFGKGKDGSENPNRPKKSIVVATQVIEQSLDLDFDYMISDIAPVDLLIQRAGRLHRHSQNNSSRPENLKNAKMQIVSPKTDAIPKFGYDEKIYDRSIMLKTWLTLKDQTEINLPSQTTFLIEKVYGEDLEINDEILRKELEDAIEKAEQEERKAISKAERQLIAKPTEPALLKQENSNLDEEDPTLNAAFRAMTRDTEPSISLICLHRVGENLYLDPANTKYPLDTAEKPDKDLIKELLKRSVNLQHYIVVDHFRDGSHGTKWKGWNEVAALKYSVPIVFENGRCKLEGTKYTLVLDRQTGLTIQKEDQ
jgi:CRISPR-associated endonuclease/helicase Cas3